MKGLGICLTVLWLMLSAFTEPHCENADAIFRDEPYEEDVYKAELARLLKAGKPDEFKYYLSGYLRPGDKEYLIVNIHGANFCAKAAITVNDWGKLQDVRRTSCRGYRGAELQGLKIAVNEENGKVEFVFEDVVAIVE
ncbi:MAG TPA: hypothetical protein VG737_00255 [Cyclobacteriaceae bacterium]|nr:hypothetical protein [Cyclobacteriaceae bacterium]